MDVLDDEEVGQFDNCVVCRYLAIQTVDLLLLLSRLRLQLDRLPLNHFSTLPNLVFALLSDSDLVVSYLRYDLRVLGLLFL